MSFFNYFHKLVPLETQKLLHINDDMLAISVDILMHWQYAENILSLKAYYLFSRQLVERQSLSPVSHSQHIIGLIPVT